jgi:hypothetical protein
MAAERTDLFAACVQIPDQVLRGAVQWRIVGAWFNYPEPYRRFVSLVPAARHQAGRVAAVHPLVVSRQNTPPCSE